MPEKRSKRRGGDNALEDYFLELIIQKHIIDREIRELLEITEKSSLHPDYQMLVKRVLFGEKNIYVQNWGTLESSLMDLIRGGELRSNMITSHGVILEMMINVIETVFNIEDDLFHDFLMSEKKEDIEHQLIILMKHMLDFTEQWLRELLSRTIHLGTPIQSWHLRQEYLVIQQALMKYPDIILSEEKDQMEYLKNQVEQFRSQIVAQKKNFSQLRSHT